MKLIKKENGALIVEATFVFPIMIFVVFILLFLGNTYYQKCRIDAILTEETINGAAYCADPVLSSIESGTIPTVDSIDISPYRYILTSGMGDVESLVEKNIKSQIEALGSGIFDGMDPDSIVVESNYNNGFIYSTFSTTVEYEITLPLKIPFQDESITINMGSQIDVPVSDSPEFIRNVNMIEDYLYRFGAGEYIDKIGDMMDNAEDWLDG